MKNNSAKKIPSDIARVDTSIEPPHSNLDDIKQLDLIEMQHKSHQI